jgi:two-component system phosphate regulon sensor histidine kinase PhoR
VAWNRRRPRPAGPPERDADLLPEVIDEAPVMVLLVDRRRRITAANQAARRFFEIPDQGLPGSLVEVTREARLVEMVSGQAAVFEVRLVHRPRTVVGRLVPASGSEQTLIFLSDVTDLRRLETVRQEFVANLSHELKTPLASLRLAAESLQGDVPPDLARKFAAQVVKEADQLTAIVDNLRQLSEIEGGAALNLERFNLADLVLEAAGRLGLEDRVDLNLPLALQAGADRVKLSQALSNLLDNAAKFSPPDSRIEVSAEETESELVIRVRDRGRGLSPEHWDRVFERFYKVDEARGRDLPGSGLGLAITKHLTLLHGGRVWSEAAPGGGQVFAMALPRPGGSVG